MIEETVHRGQELRALDRVGGSGRGREREREREREGGGAVGSLRLFFQDFGNVLKDSRKGSHRRSRRIGPAGSDRPSIDWR